MDHLQFQKGNARKYQKMQELQEHSNQEKKSRRVYHHISILSPPLHVFPLNLKRVNVSPPNRPPCCQWQKTESRDLSSDSPVPISVALNKDLRQFTWMANKLSYWAQKYQNMPPKKSQRLSNLLHRPSNPISCGLGKDLQHHISFLNTSFKYFQSTHSLRKLFSETCWCILDIPWSSFPWYQCSLRLSLLTLFHSIYPTACCEFPPKPLPSSSASSWKFPLSLPKPSVSPFPLKGSRNIHLCAAPALAGKMKWKKSDPCGKTFCCCKVCTFLGGWHLSLKMSQCLSALSVFALVGCLDIWQSISVIVIEGLPEL